MFEAFIESLDNSEQTAIHDLASRDHTFADYLSGPGVYLLRLPCRRPLYAGRTLLDKLLIERMRDHIYRGNSEIIQNLSMPNHDGKWTDWYRTEDWLRNCGGYFQAIRTDDPEIREKCEKFVIHHHQPMANFNDRKITRDQWDLERSIFRASPSWERSRIDCCGRTNPERIP